MDAPPPFPQDASSSPFPIEPPLPASLLLDQELARKEALAAKGNILTGCGELDDYVLLGGFGRGSVVGVSAEEEGVGLLIGLQTVARLLATDESARAMVVTTLPATVLLPQLRKALVGQLSALQGGPLNLQVGVRGALKRISIARVFDIEGLGEVLGELEGAVSVADARVPPQPVQEAEAEAEAGRMADIPAKEDTEGQRQPRTEVLDSEDEGGLSSPEPSPTRDPTPQLDAIPPDPEAAQPPTLPDLILITHTSTLLNTLFQSRDKDMAHEATTLLASRLHTLTRSPAGGGPLIMFLNSTTSPSTTAHHTDPTRGEGGGGGGREDDNRPQKQMTDPTLRSVFNPLPPSSTMAGQQQPGHNFASVSASVTRNKPFFGLVFSKMLDLHLLCTRVPRTRADGAALGVTSQGVAAVGGSFVWVVEVLLDEVGVYERDGESGSFDWGRRRSREQRWGVVDFDGEGRVVDGVGVGLEVGEGEGLR